MGHLERQLIDKATRKHKKIYPCAHKGNIDECFTRDEGRLMLWFNTEDQSTHVVTTGVRKNKKKF
jgi:transposase